MSSCAVREHPHAVRSLCPAVHINCCRSFTKVREGEEDDDDDLV